jgi:phosphoglucan,water dikinase
MHPKVRIGTQSAFSAETILAPFEYASGNSFEAFEWLPDKKESGTGWQENDVDAKTRRYIRTTAREKDIQLSVHAPWHLNPAIPGIEKRLAETIAFAKDIHASLLNIHLYTNQGLETYVRGIVPIAAVLARNNIMLSVENTPLTSPEDFNAFFVRLKELAPQTVPHVGMCLDVGHANLCEATQNDYLQFVDRLSPDVPIIHVHLHENYGDADSHLTVFTGPSKNDETGIRGLVDRMKQRGFSGSVILEQWPDPPSLLNAARDKLEAMFSNTKKKAPPVGSTSEEGLLNQFAQANTQYRSWRQRLTWIRDLLEERGAELEIDLLAYLAIYLRFIGTGVVPCDEDGKHYRPSRHATIAKDIFSLLMKATKPENAFVIRKIYPWLPSFRGAFTRAEPLTRIRDIAHRNDISKSLKKEIKTTLQNKLHRCAGPEDLTTSANLLRKITASPEDYPRDFVNAFQLFHKKLQEFFNASSLEERLQSMIEPKRGKKSRARGPDRSTALLIKRFLKVKQQDPSFERSLETFELSTALRNSLVERLGYAKASRNQELLTTDIALEDFAFALLGQLVNHLYAGKEDIPWPSAIRIVELATRNIRLSQYRAPECLAMEAELDAWGETFDSDDQHHLLRLKATLERCRRLADTYSESTLTLFVEKAAAMGKVLGLSKNAMDAFCEADIRSHLVFQLSRGLDLLLLSLRRHTGASPWDVIVTGDAVGLLVSTLASSPSGKTANGPVILLRETIAEDETLPKAVIGVIAAQPIPHLSHLAIRLRHDGVPCAVCEERNRLVAFSKLVGQWVSLVVSEEDVTLQAMTNEKARRAETNVVQTVQTSHIPSVTLSTAPPLLPLNEVTVSTGGSKAYRAKTLKTLSTQPEAGFQAPQGLVVPFGIMETALEAEPSLEQSYWADVKRLKGLGEPALSETLGRIRDMIGKLHVPEEITEGVTKEFSTKRRLVVRSSASVEDLNGAAAAGIYDSVINVLPSDVDAAVRRVWTSLWTKRAFLVRDRLGIFHEACHMAVLIQPMLVPEYAFVMHTINPMNNSTEEITVELTVGLGQPLASGEIPGNPYRLICHKKTGKVRPRAYASFDYALVPGPPGKLIKETIDYSKIRLSTDLALGNSLTSRLTTIGQFVEEYMGAPQDIEGVVMQEKVYLVQTRPQVVMGRNVGISQEVLMGKTVTGHQNGNPIVTTGP